MRLSIKLYRIGNDVRINGGSHLANTDHALYSVKMALVVENSEYYLMDL
jgi:glucose-1-phosphate adenylyltransferase